MGNKKYSAEETSMIVSMFSNGSKVDDVILACAERFGTKRSKRSITLHNKQNSEAGTDTLDSVTEQTTQPIEEETTETAEETETIKAV